MGLDIRGVTIKKVFSLRKLQDDEDEDEVYKKTFTFPQFFRSLTKDEEINYEGEEINCIHNGISMSYGGYEQFRQKFCKLMLNKSYDTILDECENLKKKAKYPNPLYHILNFSDSEGYIGPKAIKEMAEYLIPENLPPNLDRDSKNLIDCIIETSTYPHGYLRFS